MNQTFLRYLPILLLTVAWEAAARLGFGAALALPPPSDVLVAFVDLVRDGDLVTNGGASLYRGAVGLGLAIVIGAVLGIVMGWWAPVRVALEPLVEIFYPMPKSALIPVTALWLGLGGGAENLAVLAGRHAPAPLC